MNKKLIRLTESDLHRIVKESVNNVINEHYLAKGSVQEWENVMQKMRELWDAGYEFFDKYYDAANGTPDEIARNLYDEFGAIGEGTVMDKASEFLEYLRTNENSMPDSVSVHEGYDDIRNTYNYNRGKW